VREVHVYDLGDDNLAPEHAAVVSSGYGFVLVVGTPAGSWQEFRHGTRVRSTALRDAAYLAGRHGTIHDHSGVAA